jgi:hypothetical protein
MDETSLQAVPEATSESSSMRTVSPTMRELSGAAPRIPRDLRLSGLAETVLPQQRGLGLAAGGSRVGDTPSDWRHAMEARLVDSGRSVSSAATGEVTRDPSLIDSVCGRARGSSGNGDET